MEHHQDEGPSKTIVRIGHVRPKDWKTLDEVIAVNVRRLRQDRGLTVTELAKKLGLGRPVVYDMEGGRDDRTQRDFKWSDLVALCGVLETTIFELVLPVDGQKVAGLENVPGVIPDEEDVQPGPPFASVGRGGLSAHLFGVGETLFTPEALKDFAENAKKVRQKRDAVVQKLASAFINEVMDAFKLSASDALAAADAREEE